MRSTFEGATIWQNGLFPSARHDWMRFHAHDVACPNETCYGQLLWTGSDRRTLRCNICKSSFRVKRFITAPEVRKENVRKADAYRGQKEGK